MLANLTAKKGKPISFALAFVLWLLIATPGTAYGQSQFIDRGFGINGFAITGAQPITTGAKVFALPNGKILVAGISFDYASDSVALILVRYNANGTTDNNFGTGGILNTKVNVGTGFADGLWGWLNWVLVQDDGKILLLAVHGEGYFGKASLYRFTEAGVRDNTFGTGGKADIQLPEHRINLFGAALQPDGKILLSGGVYNSVTGAEKACLFRLHTNGSADLTFSNDGASLFDIPTPGLLLLGLTPLAQSNGNITVGCKSLETATGNEAAALIRFTASGTPDPSYGVVVDNSERDGTSLPRFSLDKTTNRIVIASEAPGVSSRNILLALYDGTGKKEKTIDFDYFAQEELLGGPVMMLPDSKIIVTGQTNSSTLAFRLRANGNIDSSFANNGIDTLTLGENTAFFTSAALQQDGKLLCTGALYDGQYKILTVRFNSSVRLFTWKGTADQLWSNPLNWDVGRVPTIDDDVLIPGGTPFAPKVTKGSLAECRKITLSPGSVLQVEQAAKLNVAGK